VSKIEKTHCYYQLENEIVDFGELYREMAARLVAPRAAAGFN
jgi:hypothetical protein